MAAEYTPEMLAMLERQVAHFGSDEFLRERADEFRQASPSECWQMTKDLCASLDWFFARMDPSAREHALTPDPLPDETIQILEAWQRQRS